MTSPDTTAREEPTKAVGVGPPFGLLRQCPRQIKDEVTGEILDVIHDDDPPRS